MTSVTRALKVFRPTLTTGAFFMSACASTWAFKGLDAIIAWMFDATVAACASILGTPRKESVQLEQPPTAKIYVKVVFEKIK